MRNISSKLIIAVLLLVLLTPAVSFARLLIPTPQQIISESNVIVVAKVTKRVLGRETLVGEFKVIKLIKGDLGDRFTVTVDSVVMGGFLQPIPKEETEVLAFLTKDASGKIGFTADVNSIGIIENGKVVDIFAGTNVKDHPYITLYNDLLQKANEKRVKPAHSLSVKKPLIKIVNSGNKKDELSVSPIWYIFGGLTVFALVAFIFIRRLSKDGQVGD
ncbi:MAG TPA: hypothetical protein VE439_05635 [Anaerolineae bacterium]|jgi:hypothetical protein|nr:hypothetical protein [Anaerolineae bacterium]